ncbi:Dihydroorotate dehydrogenase (quinone) [Alteripontixanthobacter maritimus]|uniref:Dihydroorotate dehydrogenase (quinone) n=1 Tax=Alteripontixanthobacter maritimus TaxID=2161824 RepID=A0A369QA10_9SPHN|nr:quinone-dependent dihydroorotate dehydrogenase [Alteripontixanthobacter maritimus]RDC61190.1 Dihydroorotate dehydrogenase (quinone) [Alteripontixanthobacter maritimus]
MLFKIARPAIFMLDPERAHRLTIAALRAAPHGAPASSGPLAVTVAGLRFANPVGLAAGFDKDAEVPDAVMGMGFGFAEVGSITPRPQAGNPKPRLFRLEQDHAVINRMGFNNSGAQTALARLTARKRRGTLGVNIGANKDSLDRIEDYAVLAKMMAPVADYLAVNISSPNTPGLRALQDESALADLLDATIAARDEAALPQPPPIFLKVAPDLQTADIEAIARLSMDRKLGALIVSNTTITRPELRSRHAGELGGLSGAPLRAMALQRIRDFRSATGGAMPLIGVGGIASADDAWERICAGASLVQLYSAMVYEGPGVARAITRRLEQRLQQSGLTSIEAAVGSE